MASRALEAAHAALEGAGLPRSQGRVLRSGQAVIVEFRDAGVVARVGHDPRKAARQVRVAERLREAEVPAVRALGKPHPVGELVVTLWERLEILERPAEPEQIGVLARQLHACSPEGLASFDPFREIDPWMPDEPDLQARAEAYREGWASRVAADPLETALIHGDLHRDNVAITPDGPVLTDLELAGHGPASWDLAPQAVAVRRYGAPETGYRRFVEAYGADILAWSEGAWMCGLYELLVTVWAIHHRDRSPRMRREAALRLAGLRGESREPWTLL